MCVFASGANLLGFYYDDGGFLLKLPTIDNPSQLWSAIDNYVPDGICMYSGSTWFSFWLEITQAAADNPSRRTRK